MAIIIKTEKAVVDGNKFRRVTYANALHTKELPEEYRDLDVWVSKNAIRQNGIVIRYRDGHRDNVWIGGDPEDSFFTEDEFQRILVTLEECGEKLVEINKRIKVEGLLKEWNGKETITI